MAIQIFDQFSFVVDNSQIIPSGLQHAVEPRQQFRQLYWVPSQRVRRA